MWKDTRSNRETAVTPALAFLEWTSLPGPVVWWLTFAVGALVGGFVVGLAVQAVVGIAGNQKMPPTALWLVRILAGIVCGWLLALALTGHGLPGLGGPGGNQNGDHSGDSSPHTDSPAGPKQDTDGKKPQETHPAQPETPPKATAEKPGDLVTIEVLPRDLVANLQKGDGPVNPDRCYRFSSGTEKKVLLDLSGVLERIRGQTRPPVREVKVILYKDSPAENTRSTGALMDALGNLRGPDGSKIAVGPDYEPRNAPR
jgi:hypothetical protein